jgi:hypothetical protein
VIGWKTLIDDWIIIKQTIYNQVGDTDSCIHLTYNLLKLHYTNLFLAHLTHPNSHVSFWHHLESVTCPLPFILLTFSKLYIYTWHRRKWYYIFIIESPISILSSFTWAAVVIVWSFDLQLPMQSVLITTNVVSLNPAQARWTRCNFMC